MLLSYSEGVVVNEMYFAGGFNLTKAFDISFSIILIQ